ncbi:MAG: hypothetical protein SFV32_09575 [Opitutaceae bacterium]|nr:hypothetical protein [Opitutaceae bacterium]
MKTMVDIHREARQLENAGREFYRAQLLQNSPIGALPTRVVSTLPAPTSERERRIEVSVIADTLIYRFVESPKVVNEGPERSSGTELLAVSPRADDVVTSVFELQEEERIVGELVKYSEYSLENPGEPKAEDISAIESVLNVKDLSVSARMRTRMEVTEFLEGKLEAGDLVSRNIDRHLHRESLTQAENHELRISVGEP